MVLIVSVLAYIAWDFTAGASSDGKRVARREDQEAAATAPGKPSAAARQKKSRKVAGKATKNAGSGNAAEAP